MAGINISEKEGPRGRITFTHGQSDLDIRVSTPTFMGKHMRLLNEKSQPLSMQELGLVSTRKKNWSQF